jgi:hypothetical protein
MHLVRWLAATSLCCALAACGGGNDFDTLGDIVEAYSEALCEKLDDCNQLGGDSVDDCVDMGIAAACSDVNCEEERDEDVSTDDVEECLDDVADLNCPITQENAVPASCQGL